MEQATELTTEFDGFVAGILTVGDSVTLSVWVNALRAAGALELIGSARHRYTQHPTNYDSVMNQMMSIHVLTSHTLMSFIQ